MRLILKYSFSKIVTAPILSYLSKLGNIIQPQRNVKPILISGSPRGGTTWIAESIAKAIGSKRILWEPLQEGNIHKKGLNFGKRPFITDEIISERQRKFFDDLLEARFSNAHTVRLRENFGNAIQLLSSKRLVIKFVRGNGVLGWLAKEYKLPKPLVIIRHPCAVISS